MDAAVLAALGVPRITPRDLSRVPSAPGLYAVHGDRSVWQQLDVGSPPDERPLYVGKAEKSLATRDVRTHFTSGKTGSSTLRRSLAALLRQRLDLHACPRNLNKPDGSANYALERDSDDRLTDWMIRNLSLAVWTSSESAVLDDLETAVLAKVRPPLNLMKVSTQWTNDIRRARGVLAVEARAWNKPM